ncbi:MAG: 4-hydroxy-tetrahydrodipicolinate reductase [Coxiellaceae bacterium]|nr:4-hydroxy-tetrahydrodipicolinate reductase [Coxiellaceae bacterium]|tara:strand:+ start:2385 stop:3122 length:738 start_codon:yes stop_codon:yes gene_type:complete
MNKKQTVKSVSPIRVAVSGARGKMGRITVIAIDNEPDLNLVATINREDDLEAVLKQALPDVLIDFTLPGCVFRHAKIAITLGIRPLIGASGLSESNIEYLKQQCQLQALGGLIAPNFSISAILMMQMAQQAARYFPHAEIIEMHHPMKVDSPSGTAIATAQRMDGMTIASEDHPASQCVQGVPIHSVRMPGMFAHQQVIFSRDGERLTLQQDCSDRQAMMPGVVLATRYVMKATALHYGLDVALG